MVKTATKRKDNETASIKKRLSAALCMLLVSLIMLISSTYAWFTLSTAPEVSNIATTVTGNGSLEIALMPTSGLTKDISKNGGSALGYGAGEKEGKTPLMTANTSWGNVVDLSDEAYGLGNIFLYPAQLNLDASKFAESPLLVPTFGYDGRPADVTTTALAHLKVDGDNKSYVPATDFGVRAISANLAEDGVVLNAFESYGYVVDLAVRINAYKDDATKTNAKLMLADPMQRIYNEEKDKDTAISDTMGDGSVMTFEAANTAGLSEAALNNLFSAIRITFVKDYGSSEGTAQILGTTYLLVDQLDKDPVTQTITLPIDKNIYQFDDEGKLLITDEKGENIGEDSLTDLPKNEAVQISAIVWLDGDKITNAGVSAEALGNLSGTLNIQFTTDAALKPIANGVLNPPKVEANEGGEVTEP